MKSQAITGKCGLSPWHGSGAALRRGRLLTAALVTLVFSSYFVTWVVAHWGWLFDPALQNDDARTALFPFHQYASNPAFADDPVAREMMAYVSPGIWGLYRVLVPWVDVYAASKWVQLLAVILLLCAGALVARSRRGGFAVAALLVYLILSDPYAVGRMAGGHARAFAFPCFALWTAGVITGSKRARYGATALGALFYPAVTLMLLAAEWSHVALLIVTSCTTRRWRSLRDIAIATAACAILSLPSVVGGDKSRGPIHTYDQALHDRAFYPEGRLAVLPFGKPVDELGHAFLTRFESSGKGLLRNVVQSDKSAAIVVILVVGGVLLAQRRKRPVLTAWFWAFLVGTTCLYFAARILAFRLYSTERYYAYAMRMASTLMLVLLCAKFQPKRWLSRTIGRNLLACAAMLVSWCSFGSGIIHNNGMTIDARWDADVYRFIRTLRPNCRFASHPMDGDGIPYFGARASIGSFETLQPWFVDSWHRQVVREQATLDALYASDNATILRYASQFKVDYLLINDDRYRDDWRTRTGSFEPFTRYAQELTARVNEPALMHVPEAAVIFHRAPWKIVAVERLR